MVDVVRVSQVQEEVSFQQGRLRDNVELLSGVIADNEHHLETAVNQ